MERTSTSVGTDPAGRGFPFDDDDADQVSHAELLQLVDDATACLRAVTVLSALLRQASPDSLDAGGRVGLAVLLDGVRGRMELTADGVAVLAAALGAPVDRVVLQ